MRILRQKTAAWVANAAYLLLAAGVPAYVHLTVDHHFDAASAPADGASRSSNHHDGAPAPGDCPVCYAIQAMVAANYTPPLTVEIAPKPTGDCLPPVARAVAIAPLTAATPRAPPLA